MAFFHRKEEIRKDKEKKITRNLEGKKFSITKRTNTKTRKKRGNHSHCISVSEKPPKKPCVLHQIDSNHLTISQIRCSAKETSLKTRCFNMQVPILSLYLHGSHWVKNIQATKAMKIKVHVWFHLNFYKYKNDLSTKNSL